MKLKRYNNFIGLEKLNENLDKSRKFLKERFLLNKVASQLGFIDNELQYKIKDGQKKTIVMSDFTPEQQQEIKSKLRETRLSDDEIRNIEKDPEFVKLKELLEQNMGFLYNFVYMYFVEMTPFNEIENLYKEILEYKPILDRLADIREVGKKFDANFIDTSIPNSKEHRTNSEILADGIERLKEYKLVKKIVDTLPRKLRQSYLDAPDMLKDEMANIAKAFDNLPDEPTKEIDPLTKKPISKKERIWKNFFGEMKVDNDATLPNGSENPNFGKLVYKSRLKRFEEVSNPIREFLKAAKLHIESSLSDGYTERIEKIDKCNDRFGVMGCEVILNEGGIMIVQVNSYSANQFLNSHCNHCIVNYASYWDQYLGDYNKQYYIYNFNLSPMDDLSTIGVTIKPDRTWASGACQSLRNNGIGHKFKSMLKEWEREYKIDTDLFKALEPMTQEEIKKRERAKAAEREIVKKGLTIEEIKKYVTEEGASINKDNAKALVNAVEDDDIDKVKLCLSLGANPNLAKGSESAISKAKNIEMIKLLVTYGSDLTGDLYTNILGSDTDSLEYCLRAGLDPNFSSSMPLRRVSRGSWEDKNNIGKSYLEAFKILLKYKASLINENGKVMIVKWASDYARKDIIDYLMEEGYTEYIKEEDIDESIEWLRHSRKLNAEIRDDMIEYLIEKRKILFKK